MTQTELKTHSRANIPAIDEFALNLGPEVNKYKLIAKCTKMSDFQQHLSNLGISISITTNCNFKKILKNKNILKKQEMCFEYQ